MLKGKRRLSQAMMAVLLALLSRPAPAEDPSYLTAFPDPERIAVDVRGRNELDTLARQLGSLNRLNTLVSDMAGRRAFTNDFPTRDEQALRERIRAVATRIDARARTLFDASKVGDGSPLAQWNQSVSGYQNDDAVYDELMRRYFTPEFRAAHQALLNDSGDRLAAIREQQRRAGRANGDPTSAWDRLSEREQGETLRVTALMLLLLVVGNLGLLKRAHFDPRDPRVLRTGFFRRSPVDWATGLVEDHRYRLEVEEETKEGHNERQLSNGEIKREAYYVTWYTAHYYEDFALVTANGRHDVHLHTMAKSRQPPLAALGNSVNAPLARAVGKRLTVAWVSRSRQRPGSYLLFHDWDGYEIAHPARTGFDLALPARLWASIPVFVLGYQLGAWTGILGTGAPQGLRGAVIGGVAVGVWVLVLMGVATVLRARFYRAEVPKFAQRIGSADALPTVPGMVPQVVPDTAGRAART